MTTAAEGNRAMANYTRYRLCIRLGNGSESRIKGLFDNVGEARFVGERMYQDRMVQSVQIEDVAGAYRENIARRGSNFDQ